MNTTTKAMTMVAAGALATLTVAATVPASAHATRHTLTMTSKQLQDRIVGGVDVATDKDIQHGAVTGYDVTSCRIDTRTHLAHCDVAVARSNGVLLGRVSVHLNTGRGNGTVLGGTRAFHGATGTISVALPRVTIVWNN